MMLWKHIPAQQHANKRRFDCFYYSDSTCSEFGMEFLTSRVSEFVMYSSMNTINPFYEKIDCTWICLTPSKIDEVLHRTPSFRVDFLTIYPLGKHEYQNRVPTLFTFALSLVKFRNSTLFENNDGSFSSKLRSLLHRCWVEAEINIKKIHGCPNHSRWPVKLWVHGIPERVWEITADDQLVERPGHPPVDESIIEPLYPQPPAEVPPPPTGLRVDITPEGAEVRWRPVPDVQGYSVEWSNDGVDFSPIGGLEGAKANPGPDGWCLWLDEVKPEQADYFVRVYSYRNDATVVSEPSATVHARWE